MATIGSAGNAITACLQALLDKGYRLRAVGPDEEGCYSYVASRDGESFAAENGMELLGLVALWEMWGEDWQNKGLGRGRKGGEDPWEQIEYEDDE